MFEKKKEVRSQKTEVGSQEKGIGSRKSGVGRPVFAMALAGSQKTGICFRKTSFLIPSAFILLTSYFISCMPKPIDIKIDTPKPKLVVASQIVPGSIMVVALTRSFSALSQTAHADSGNNYMDSIVTKNAFVTVTHNGKTDTLLMVVPGIYASLNTLQENYGTYTLYAKDTEQNLEAKATTTLLPAVKFDTIIPKVDKTAKDTVVSVEYTFTDLPGVDNYYVVSYFLKRSGGSSSIDINNYFNRGSNQLNAMDIFSDKTFDKPKFTFNRKFEGIKATDTVALVLANISKGYYEFLTAYQRAGGWFNQLSGEPINYPTNVEGGFGYFNTYYPDYRIYYLKDY